MRIPATTDLPRPGKSVFFFLSPTHKEFPMGAKITLNGNLGDDPRHGVAKNRLGEDLPWVSFSMRQPHWVRENNEPVDKGGFWINVSWFSRKAEFAATLLKKGAAVIVSGDLHVEFWTDQETGELRSSFKVSADEVSLDMRALSGVTYRNRSFQGPQPQPNVDKMDEPRQQDGLGAGTSSQRTARAQQQPPAQAPYGDNGYDDTGFAAATPPDYLDEVPPPGAEDLPGGVGTDKAKPAGKGGMAKNTAARPQDALPDDDFPV